MAKGLVLSIAYGIAYLVLRYFSFDQWFLPAGLRALCLFFLPFRYWPFVFVGDAAAVMYGRLSIADENSTIWVYFGPFALIAGISIAPYFLRKKLANSKAITCHLPIAAACFAAGSSLCTVGLNAILGGPSENATIAFFMTRLFGNYLGALMGMLPVLVWINRHQHAGPWKKTILDIAMAATAIAVMFAYLEYWHTGDEVGTNSILMLMICPALFLMYYHGWLGAAIGVLLVNLGITLTMTYTGIPGTYDETAFLAQIGLSIAASAFLILGWRITSHYENAIDAGVAEEEARRISRLALLSNDDVARDHVLYMAQLYLLVEEEKRNMVHRLTAQGMHKEAFALNSQGVEHRKLFDQHVLALYPISIEEKGLFAVVQSQAFEDRWAAGAPLSIRFDDGDPKRLSLRLQLATYRCLSSAIIMLRDWTPEEFRIRIRVWHTPSHRGVYFSGSS
jgi:MASE1